MESTQSNLMISSTIFRFLNLKLSSTRYHYVPYKNRNNFDLIDFKRKKTSRC